MNRGRAQRRAHFERIKRKVSKHSWFRNHEQGGYEIPEPRELGIWSKTPKRCSCVICGHIRDVDLNPSSKLRRVLRVSMFLLCMSMMKGLLIFVMWINLNVLHVEVCT